MNLTKRQQEIFEFLSEKSRQGHSAPSIESLCHDLGLSSRGSMHKHIQALVSAGLIEPLNGLQRGIRLAEVSAESPSCLPYLGIIAAGRPIEAIENPEPVQVPDFLRGSGDCYVLKVRGDSMVDAGILNGDWVVIEKRSYARNGEIVVALIDQREATLKRIQQEADRVLLIPENEEMEPQVYEPDRVIIQGVLVGQMRAYR